MFEELLFQHLTNRLSIQFHIMAHNRPNFMYVKTFFGMGNLQEGGYFNLEYQNNEEDEIEWIP